MKAYFLYFAFLTPFAAHAGLDCDTSTLLANSKSVQKVFAPQMRQLLFDVAREAGISIASSRVQLISTRRGENVYGAEGVTFNFRVSATTTQGTKIRISNGSDNTWDAGSKYVQLWMVARSYVSVGGSEGAQLACTGSQNVLGVQRMINESTGASFFESYARLRKWSENFVVPVGR